MQTSLAARSVDHGPDVISLLIADHSTLRPLSAGLVREQRPLARRAQLQRLARHLVRHETAEERALYPVIGSIDGGGELRRELLRQEQDLSRALASLMRRLSWRPNGRKSQQRIAGFCALLEHHLAFEEATLIPILLVEGEEKRQMVGTWLRSAGNLAPTRPHPHGPQRLPGLLTIGVLLGIVDRITDWAVGLERGSADNPREHSS